MPSKSAKLEQPSRLEFEVDGCVVSASMYTDLMDRLVERLALTGYSEYRVSVVRNAEQE